MTKTSQRNWQKMTQAAEEASPCGEFRGISVGIHARGMNVHLQSRRTSSKTLRKMSAWCCCKMRAGLRRSVHSPLPLTRTPEHVHIPPRFNWQFCWYTGVSRSPPLILTLHSPVVPNLSILTTLHGWPLYSPCQIPRFFQVFPTEASMFIKPVAVFRQAYVFSWVNTAALFAVHLVQVNLI